MVLFSYLTKALDESAWPTVRRTAHGILQETEETLMGTMAERLLREGREEGLEKGLKKGREEGREEGWEQGQRALLIELLETKFGKLDEQDRRRIDAADVLARKRYVQRALTATTLNEVFASES